MSEKHREVIRMMKADEGIAMNRGKQTSMNTN